MKKKPKKNSVPWSATWNSRSTYWLSQERIKRNIVYWTLTMYAPSLVSCSACPLPHVSSVRSLQREAGAYQLWSKGWWFPSITDQHCSWAKFMLACGYIRRIWTRRWVLLEAICVWYRGLHSEIIFFPLWVLKYLFSYERIATSYGNFTIAVFNIFTSQDKS